MRKNKIDHVAHSIQARKQALAMWDRIYNGYLEGRESKENLAMGMAVLNSVDQGICSSPYLSIEDKNRIWSEAK